MQLRDEKGSISILTIGLFGILFVTSLILIDISSIYIAKRSLTQATEAATQQGVKNLDKESYYKGEFNINRFNSSIYGFGEKDPGIPINCDEGVHGAETVLAGWQDRGSSIAPSSLREISLVDYNCDGYEFELQVRAQAKLPIPIPFTGINEVTLKAKVRTMAERAKSNNYTGLNIG
jgi:hypothetical protein